MDRAESSGRLMDMATKRYKGYVVKERDVDSQRRLGSASITAFCVDRDGDVLNPMGLAPDEFYANPVVLLNHDHDGLPVGKSGKGQLEFTEREVGAVWEFAPETHNPRAEWVFNLWRDGYLNACSVCFDPNADATRRKVLEGQTGYYFPTSNLFEFSIVTLPAVPTALRRSKSMGTYKRLAQNTPLYASYFLVDGTTPENPYIVEVRGEELAELVHRLPDHDLKGAGEYAVISDYLVRREFRAIDTNDFNSARTVCETILSREKCRDIYMVVLAKRIGQDENGIEIYATVEEMYHNFSAKRVKVPQSISELDSALHISSEESGVLVANPQDGNANGFSELILSESGVPGGVLLSSESNPSNNRISNLKTVKTGSPGLKRKHYCKNLAAKIFNTPHLIHPQKLESILHVLGDRIGVTADHHFEMAHRELDVRSDEGEMLFKLIDGVAMIPVKGTLIDRGSWITAMSGLTSYDFIQKAFDAAIEDDDVRAIGFDIDSPGGMVSGLFDLVEHINERKADATKPIHAIIYDGAFSAAYAIAATADEINISKTASVGSIGVVVAHQSYAGWNEQVGREVTYIFAGDKKVDGNPDEPLSERARKDIQADVDTIYDFFVEVVADGRSLPESAVRSTQAGTFMGDEAVEMGLADNVMNPKLSFDSLRKQGLLAHPLLEGGKHSPEDEDEIDELLDE